MKENLHEYILPQGNGKSFVTHMINNYKNKTTPNIDETKKTRQGKRKLERQERKNQKKIIG